MRNGENHPDGWSVEDEVAAVREGLFAVVAGLGGEIAALQEIGDEWARAKAQGFRGRTDVEAVERRFTAVRLRLWALLDQMTGYPELLAAAEVPQAQALEAACKEMENIVGTRLGRISEFLKTCRDEQFPPDPS